MKQISLTDVRQELPASGFRLVDDIAKALGITIEALKTGCRADELAGKITVVVTIIRDPEHPMTVGTVDEEYWGWPEWGPYSREEVAKGLPRPLGAEGDNEIKETE